MSAAVEQLVRMAEAAGATVVRSPAGTIIVLPISQGADPGEHLSLEEARVLGKLASTRQIKEAGHRGELTLYGSERTRTVKRGELVAWLESRRSPAAAVPKGQAGRVEARLRRAAGPR